MLLDRALPLEQAGKWQSAVELCREAFKQSVRYRDAESLREAVLRTGLCYRQMGERELAEEHLSLAHTTSELHGDRIRSGRALNGMATLHHIHGELTEAERFYGLAAQVSRDTDALLTGNINQNLGALSVLRGDTEHALAYLAAAKAAYRAIDHERGIAQVLNNLGSLYVAQGAFDIADEHLGNALVACRRLGDPLTEATVQINRTELFLGWANLPEARSSCDEAFEIFSRLEEHAGRSEALKFYGIIYRESGKHYLAETHLREAIEVAASHEFPIEEAEAYRELALVLRQQGRNREALSALNRSHELLSDMQASQYQAETEKRIAHIENDFLSLVRAWGESIEAKDLYTRGHCQRVADYACRIAERYGMPKKDLFWFRMGAFLHDLGKTEVPEEILNKPGTLTEEERVAMERHPVVGYEMLSSIEFPWDILPMVRSHHERWDGRGYPDRLANTAIPFTARILRIADVFDALTTTRSYREPLTAEAALKIMEEDTGSFDPELFEIFRSLLPELQNIASILANADRGE